MRISENGVRFIKRWEGMVGKAYRDVAGVLTIGYGHTAGFRNGRFTQNSVITPEEADGLLYDDLVPREAQVAALVGVDINQNEFDALVSFEFNTGALARATALRLLNADDRIGAANALTWWNKATIGGKLTTVPGLARRRAAEADLFLTPP